MTRKVTLVEIMMIISETSSALGYVGILSNIMSGRGGYLSLSGTRSCTNARDAVVRMKFTVNIMNAEKDKTKKFSVNSVKIKLQILQQILKKILFLLKKNQTNGLKGYRICCEY